MMLTDTVNSRNAEVQQWGYIILPINKKVWIVSSDLTTHLVYTGRQNNYRKACKVLSTHTHTHI